MLNLDDLDKVYDPSTLTIANQDGNQQGPGPKSKPLPTLAQADNPIGSTVNFGQAKPVDVRGYGEQLTNGVYSDQDIDSQRGQHQSVIAKLGHALGNLPLNIVGSFMEGIGDMGLLAGQWGDDRDYTNGLIEAGKSLHNITGDIYMSNPHATLVQTLSDPGWWIDQTEGLAEFGVSYAALGAGVSGAMSKLAEGASTLIKAGEATSRGMQAVGQLGAAGFMSYTMGAQNAANVFKQTYEYQFRKLLDAGQDQDTAASNAKHIAAQSAATTAQLTTAIGTTLALGSMAPFFRKSEDVALNILRKQVPKLVGEEDTAWLSRVRSIDPDAYQALLNPGKSWSNRLLEMGKMGVEMQQLQFGEKTGTKLGHDGKIKGFLDQFDELSNYLDRTMDKDGGLAFAIGVGAGMITHKLSNDVIPSKWADKIDPTTGQAIPKVDDAGNIVGTQKKLYTPKALTEMHGAAAFTRMRDAIASDIEQYQKMQQSYLAAVKAGDPVSIDRARDELFNINNVNGIINGMGDMWKKTYTDIVGMGLDEALQKGFATDEKDTDYQYKAALAADRIDKYQKIYDKLNARYGTFYANHKGYQPVVDGLFTRKVHIDAWEDILKEHEEKLTKYNEEEGKILSTANPELFDEHTAAYTRSWDSVDKTMKKLQGDHKMINGLVEEYNKGDEVKRKQIAEQMSAIAREYSAIDPEANNSIQALSKSMNATLDRISSSLDDLKETAKTVQDTLFTSTGYTKWLEKNEGKSFEDYMDAIHKHMGMTEYQHQIELSREKLNIAKKNAADLEKEKNLTRFANKYSKYMDDEIRKSNEFEKNQNEELAERAKGGKIMDEAQRQKLHEMAERYKAIRDEHVKAFGTEQTFLASLHTQMNDAVENQRYESKLALAPKIRESEKKSAALFEKIKKYDSLYIANKPDIPNQEPVSVDKLTIAPSSLSSSSVDTISPESLMANDIVTTIPDITDLDETIKSQAVQKLEELEKPVIEAEKVLNDKVKVLKESAPNLTKILGPLLKEAEDNGSVSLDSLNFMIVMGDISQEDGVQLTYNLNQYVDAQNKFNNLKDLIEYQEEAPVIGESPVPEVDTIDIDRSIDVPIVTREEPKDEDYSPLDDYTISDDRTVQANTIANSTLGFVNLSPGHDQLTSVQDAINKKINPDVLRGDKLKPGHNIRFEVDVEYDGPKNVIGAEKGTTSKESFADYSNKNGKVPADKMGNVPIKIVDNTTNRTIGYVRKHEWITEEKDGALRNIAEKYDDNGKEINGPIQSKKILDIRKAIVDQFNANGKSINGRIASKSVGHVILNQEGFKPKPAHAFNRKDTGLLPDPKLKLTVANGGKLYSGKNYIFDRDVAGETKGLPNGSVYAMLPGANGSHISAPLIGPSLGETDIPHRTISRAIELYLGYNGAEEDGRTHEIRNLQNKTGHDISTENGLRNFINQYFTHLQSFADTATISSGKGRSQFLFNVWDKISGKEGKAWIKAGWSESGQTPIIASLGNDGRLSSEFSSLLAEGLRTRTKSVLFTRNGVRGINEPMDKDNPFVDATYNKAGKWVHNEYSDYNEYVKSFSKTTVYGRNKLGNDYVYTANPSISYDMDKVHIESPTTLVEENNSTHVQLEEKNEVGYDKSAADEMDDIFNTAPRIAETSKSIGTGSEKTKELNLKNLEDLYTFTPEEQRNGKVPSDVLRELSDRGHSFIPDGYNPFSLCL